MFKPLKDITILDLTQVLAGPYGSYQLSLLGANVIKIENPNLGDWARMGGDDKELSDDLMGSSFIVQNGNKRSIRLDLKNKIGKSTFNEFVRQSDVVMENMTPGKFKKLGFSFDNLKKINPSIILCSISAYGQNGDLGNRSAYDHVVQASSGIMSTTGTEISGPLKVGAPYIDYATGLNSAFAVTAAIANLRKDKSAKWLDISMYDTSLFLMSSLVSTTLNSNIKLKPNGNEAWSGSPSSGCFEASCGSLLSIAANTQKQFEMMCETLFGKNMEENSKWFDLKYRVKNKNLLKITNDPYTAVLGANVLYTDVWSSMGEENQKEEKDKEFLGFTIDHNLVRNANKDAIILHCLPAYRSKEITDEVFESKKNRIFDQAENRLHAQQALLSCLLN